MGVTWKIVAKVEYDFKLQTSYKNWSWDRSFWANNIQFNSYEQDWW